MDAMPRKFRKSKNKIINGVCAGSAEWLGWNASTGRFFFVLVSVMSVIVPGIVVYIILSILMPPAEDTPAP